MQDSAPLPSEEPKASPSAGEPSGANGAPDAVQQPAGRQVPVEQSAVGGESPAATPNQPTSEPIEKAKPQVAPAAEAGELAEHQQESQDGAAKEVAGESDAPKTPGAEPVAQAGAGATGVSPGIEEEPEEADEQPVPAAKGPIEETPVAPPEIPPFQWYIIRVAVNRETYAAESLRRRIEIAGMQDYFGEIVVPTEDVVEFTKTGKKRTVKRKLFPGYIMVRMALTDDTWFLVRETPGIGDFTGGAGRPTPMTADEVRRIIKPEVEEGEEEPSVRIAIPFSVGDRVRVKEGYFQNFEGDVAAIDETNGRVTVMINIFGRSTPVELQHWQMERI
ncbi:MAG: hypothetical protein KatS3mg110_2670 [Pirellulaceae bacterium]|nr:MAG: hypothetical protein KatS3mg110_2670 [Pirellulaceae bacterium]